MRLGAIMVPLNWRLSSVELEALCADAEPRLMLHDAVWQETAELVAAATRVTATMGWRCPDAAIDFDAAAAKSTPMASTPHLRRLSDPALILHTSGTTGLPKGAITTAGTMAWQTLNTAQEALLTGPGTKMANPLPLMHAGGLTTVAVPMLRTGGCVAVARRFDPDQIMAALSDPTKGLTHVTMPPVMYQYLALTAAFSSSDLSSIRFAQVAGGVPSQELVDTWASKGVVLQAAYGGTELGPAVTTMPRQSAAGRPTSCGRAVPFTCVRLVRPDGVEAEVGEVGEVWIAGPSVTPGYWRRPEGFGFSDGWFCTGDAARRDEEGYYYLVDRVKDMYKSGGENVYPAEVERVIAEHPEVVEVAVVGVPDGQWGEVGRAFVVVRNGSELDLEAIRDFCTGRLARYKHPKSAVIRHEPLPRNTTGKIQKAQWQSWER
jgi:fatty-acyl-CoA synthase